MSLVLPCHQDRDKAVLGGHTRQWNSIDFFFFPCQKKDKNKENKNTKYIVGDPASNKPQTSNNNNNNISNSTERKDEAYCVPDPRQDYGPQPRPVLHSYLLLGNQSPKYPLCTNKG